MEINSSGISLEIQEAPLIVLSIPPNQSNKIIPLSFWLRITNNSKSLFFYNYGNLIPELFNQSGQKLTEKSPYNIIRKYRIATIQVGSTIGHKIEGRIFVLDNFLRIESR
ncbi:MAG: hypothetical protein QNJ70_09060 [Xenococcaceae cyanobacterium MO_207.B15]|nr:hypothetical protein [Xenococcaceae cyanobacterium MO_207.B15]